MLLPVDFGGSAWEYAVHQVSGLTHLDWLQEVCLGDKFGVHFELLAPRPIKRNLFRIVPSEVRSGDKFGFHFELLAPRPINRNCSELQ